MRLLTDAVLAKLQSNGGGFAIGDAQAPADTTTPYAVLYPLDESGRDGDMATIDVTGWFEYQVTTVGDTREQAEGLADVLRTLILAADLTPTGFRMFPWRLAVTQYVDRDDEVQPPVFYAIFAVEGFVAPTV